MKTGIFALLFMISAINLNAQTYIEAVAGMHVGKVPLTITPPEFFGERTALLNFAPGMRLQIQHAYRKRLNIIIGLEMVQNKTSYYLEDGGIFSEPSISFTWYYLRLPILAAYTIYDSGIKVKLIGGINYGATARITYEYEPDFGLYTGNVSTESAEYRRFDLGLQYGIRLQKQMNEDYYAFASASQNRSLTDLDKLKDSSFRPTFVSLRIGFGANLSKPNLNTRR